MKTSFFPILPVFPSDSRNAIIFGDNVGEIEIASIPNMLATIITKGELTVKVRTWRSDYSKEIKKRYEIYYSGILRDYSTELRQAASSIRFVLRIEENKTQRRIKVKYQNSWYGYQGCDGFALYVNGQKMHIGLFVSIRALREYWHRYQPMLSCGEIPAQSFSRDGIKPIPF